MLFFVQSCLFLNFLKLGKGSIEIDSILSNSKMVLVIIIKANNGTYEWINGFGWAYSPKPDQFKAESCIYTYNIIIHADLEILLLAK